MIRQGSPWRAATRKGVAALFHARLDGDAAGADRARSSVKVERLRRAVCAAICAALLVSGCASGSATVTGTLEGSHGACLYVLVPHRDATDRYWLRHLPSGYEADEHGLHGPNGSLIRMGDSVTVSGALSWQPFDHLCAGEHTLDVTAIN
ncbi:MAG: hypothetical protein ACP5VP_04745 [Candidatus Limnocylindrales bacterium]